MAHTEIDPKEVLALTTAQTKLATAKQLRDNRMANLLKDYYRGPVVILLKDDSMLEGTIEMGTKELLIVRTRDFKLERIKVADIADMDIR